MTTSSDERLAEAIEQLANEQKAGRVPDITAVSRNHPDLASEIRALWAVAQFAHLARKSDSTRVQVKLEPSLHVAEEEVSPLRAFGDFEIIEEIGRGGMGVVYKARQKSLNRIVALKMIREAHLSTADDRSRFQREAEAVARLKHPNIVTVHEVGTVGGQAYLCMEFIGGSTLAQKVIAEGPLPAREAARLVAAIARAVHHAHEEGVLHRDLKPSNILLDADLRPNRAEGKPGSLEGSSDSFPTMPRFTFSPKVMDFGLAKRIDSTVSFTRTGAVVGTPSYMSPEQASGRKDLTPAADVYSLGAILYELLTCRPPFRAAHPLDTLLLVLEQEPIPPRHLNPMVDRELELICLKCLQKPVELRYPTAAALAADLEAYAAGESISAQPSGLRFFISRMFRETHHADILENWGKLWMWHSLMIFLLCLATQIMEWSKVGDHLSYLMLWSVGLVTWGTIFWQLRRRAGPVLFVERQIAHAWAAGVCASIGMFVIEWLAQLPALTLSPAVAVAAGMVFIFKAGILSGKFYLWAALNFLAACIMPLVPQVSILLFGFVSALSFFVPGVIYNRQRKQTAARLSQGAGQSNL